MWCIQIQTGVSLNHAHYLNANNLVSKHNFIKIVNTTKVHEWTLTCFKFYIIEDVTLKCKVSEYVLSVLHNILSIP